MWVTRKKLRRFAAVRFFCFLFKHLFHAWRKRAPITRRIASTLHAGLLALRIITLWPSFPDTMPSGKLAGFLAYSGGTAQDLNLFPS